MRPTRSEGRQADRHRESRIAYDLAVSAPVVVILAAGQGTRMRSEVQKLLHPLCGRPMIAWPITAAQAAGPPKIVVVDSPERSLESAVSQFDGQVALAVQERPLGTADAVKAATSEIGASGTVVVLNGDVPLITARDARRAGRPITSAAAPRRTIATMVLDDPAGYGRVVRAPDGTVERVVETKGPGDARGARAPHPRGQHRMFAFEGAALPPACGRCAPTTPRASSTSPTCSRSCATTSAR